MLRSLIQSPTACAIPSTVRGDPRLLNSNTHTSDLRAKVAERRRRYQAESPNPGNITNGGDFRARIDGKQVSRIITHPGAVCLPALFRAAGPPLRAQSFPEILSHPPAQLLHALPLRSVARENRRPSAGSIPLWPRRQEQRVPRVRQARRRETLRQRMRARANCAEWPLWQRRQATPAAGVAAQDPHIPPQTGEPMRARRQKND